MEKDKKMSVKDFIKQRKTQFKNIKNKQAQTDEITKFIDTQNIQGFQEALCELKNQDIIFYIFSEDSMKVTPLMKILSCENIDKWLSIVFSEINKSWPVIDEKICKLWKENDLIANDWKNKLTIFNRSVVKLILQLPEKDRLQLGNKIVKEFCSDQNFVSGLYRQYLLIDFVKQHFPLNIKVNENLLELASILEVFYIPLAEKLWPNAENQLYLKFVDFRNSLIKDNIWNSGDFINAIKMNKMNEYTFELKEMHHNFMHQLALHHKIQTMIQAHKLMEDSQNPQYLKLLKKVYSSFQSDQETPIDIALKTWEFTQLELLMKFISNKPQTIRFSTNSLNFILQNQSLGQQHKQQLIMEILSQNFSDRGYIEIVKLDKHVQKKFATSQKSIQMYLTTNQFSSLIIYDTDKLIYKKYKNSYPLLSYLHQFRENSNLKIVERLFLKNLLDRKSSKLKILSTIKVFWKNTESKIQQNSQGHKQIQELLFYHTPLLYLIAKLQPCQSTQYLLDKIFFNCPELYFKKNNGSLEVGLGRHFLSIYLQKCSLSQNSQNNFILEKIFLSKESERLIGTKYNFYIELLKALNLSNVFIQSKNEFYMIRQIRFYLRQYFDSLQPQQLFQSDYFTELSWFFFSVKMKKKGKKQQKYSIGKDWGLYDADQICTKLKKINLKKYLQVNNEQKDIKLQDKNYIYQKQSVSAKAQQTQEEEKDPTKISEIQKIAKILINYQNKIQDEEDQVQQLPYPDFGDESVFWFKTRYHQYKTYNSLKKYLQKIKYDFDKSDTPQNQVPQIQISMTEKHLEQKINLLIKQGFQFYFCKRQIQAIKRQQEMDENDKRIYELTHQKINYMKKTQIKDKLLNKILQRMIERKLSFIMALVYCQQNQVDDLDYIVKTKYSDVLTNLVMEFIKQRNQQSPRLSLDFAYPQQPVQPIPFHTLLKVEKLMKSVNNQENLSYFSIQTILNNFFMNIQAKIMLFEHLQTPKFKKHQIQFEKKQKTKDLVQYWLKWHQQIKERLSYKQNIQNLIEQNRKQMQNKYQDREQEQQPDVRSQKSLLEKYYSMLGERILLKYHKIRLDMNQLLLKLSTQELFLIDCLIDSEENYYLMLVYKMEVQQNPYDFFIQRTKIMHLLRPLTGDKQHKNIQRIFINQLQKVNLQQFKQIIKLIENSMFVPIWDIFNNTKDQQKMIFLLEYVLQSNKEEYLQKFTPTYLLGLIRQDMPQFTTRTILTVNKEKFSFAINENIQNRTKRLRTDNVAFYHQCQFNTFLKLIEPIKKYFVKASDFVPSQLIQVKIKQIVGSLASRQAWDRLQVLLKMENFDNMEIFVEVSFIYIGQILHANKNYLQNSQKSKTLLWMIDRLFELYNQFSIFFYEQTFQNAFICNPSKAFQVFKPFNNQLTIQTIVKCLKTYPQQANRFLTQQLKLNTLIKPDPIYFKQNFPLTPYYYEEFGNNSWMLDLLRVERKVLKAYDELNRLDKTMQSLILLKKMDDNFEEFYTQQEIQLKCSKLLSSNTLTSIKKYPQKWFQQYFMKNDIKNLSILTQELLIELIDMRYVKKNHIFKVISTCKLDIVKYFFKKYDIQLNLKTIEQLQKETLQNKYKKNIWQFFTNIQNQNFVIEFIKFYNLIEVCPVESYQDILLTNIALYKRISLLRFLLEYLTKKTGRQLQFVFNKKGKILHYLVTFPQEISVTMNFYEYYFLVKQSKNQCPDFYISSRFLINNDNYEQQLQKYNFIPEMKRRLQILNILCNVPNVNRDMNWKSNILLKYIFGLKQHPQNSNPIQTDIPSQKKWSHFITYIVEQDPKVFEQQDIGSLCHTLILYLSVSKTGISVQQIAKLYPKEIEIIKKVDKFLKKKADVSKFTFKVIKSDPQLKAILLADNFDLFMKDFQNQLNLISNFDDAFLYLRGVLVNLKAFETQQKYRKYLQNILSLCFSSNYNSYVLGSNYSMYLKKSILTLMLVSYCQGNGFTFSQLCQILNLRKQQPGNILYFAATKANQVTVKGNLEPFFDIRSWNSVIEQIEQLKSPLNQQKDTFDLGVLMVKSLQKLQNDLFDKFKIRVQNLMQVLQKSISKTKQNNKSNIFELITLFINQTYILSNCNQFHREMESFKENSLFNKTIIIRFEPQQQFDLNIPTQNDKNIQFTIPYTWVNAQSQIPLMHFDVSDIMHRAQKQILLHQLTLNPQIDALNKLYQNLTDSSFKNLRFIFDSQSLRKLNNKGSLKKIVEYFPMRESGISQIQKTLTQIDEKVFSDKSIPYYSLSDVYGPIKLSQEQNHQKLKDCLSFYEILSLPSREIVVEIIDRKPSQQQINEKCQNDFFDYVKYILNEIKDTHPADMVGSYNFSNKIQLYIDEETLEILTFTHQFSLTNILKCFSLVSASSDERRRTFENKIDVRYDVLSIINFYQYLNETSKQQNDQQKSSSIFTFLQSFLRNQRTTKLVDKVLLLIIEDAINIMKVLKGALISFSINKQKPETSKDKKYWIDQNTSVNKISFQIQGQILRIMIDVDISSAKQSKQNSIEIQETNLVSRSNFLESIFSSTQFLTDYFLLKGVIDTECIKISRSLSQKLNTTLNVHINYKSLYSFIDGIKKELPIKDIDNYLYTLRMHLLTNLESKLLQHFTSTQIHQQHQALLINTFQVLYHQLSQNNHNHFNTESLQKEVNLLQNSQVLEFECMKKVQQPPLRYIDGYGQQVDNFSNLGKNVFLIQVFKNYFTTLVNQGMTFVIGFKESGKSPTLIKFIKRQDIDRININEISYILLVSQNIPCNDQLDHRKIIRIFVTDMHKNVYQISQLIKNHLLNFQGDDEQLRNINSLISVIPRNIGIDFDNQNNLIPQNSKLSQKRGLKIFEIKLTKQPKFKILPTKQQPMQLCNYLRKHLDLNKHIKSFIDKMRIQWQSKELKLIIDINQMITTGLNYEKVTQALKNSLLDLQQTLEFYWENPSTNPDFDCQLSINRLDKVNIKYNNILYERESTFLKYFKQIKFLLTETKFPKIKIQGDQILFEISANVEQYIKSKEILYQILDEIVNRKIEQNNSNVSIKEQQRPDLNTIELLKCIDIINITDFLSKEIQKAYDLFRIIKNQPLKQSINIHYKLQKGKRSYLEFSSNQKGNKITVNFNINNLECQFFTASQVLTIMLKNFVDSNKVQTFDTQYDSQTNSIKVYGLVKDQYMLVIDDELSPQMQKVNVNKLSNTNGMIQIKQKINSSLENEIKRYFLVDVQNKQAHENYIYFINPAKNQKLVNQKISSVSIDQSICIYVKDTKDNSIINLQNLPITMSLLKPNDKRPHNYENLMINDYLNYFSIKMISRQVAKISFKFDKACNASINLGGFKNIFDTENRDTYQIIVSSNQQAVIENTKFVEVHFRNKIHQSKEIKQSDKKAKDKKVFQEPAEKQNITEKQYTEQQINKKANEAQSLVYVVNNQSKNYLTRAGQKRVDFIQVCDADFNPIQYKGDINIYFRHINNLCTIKPQIERKGLRIGLAWTPIIRGHYKVYFNGLCLNPDYEIGVCAAVADPLLSTVQKPKVNKICFFQETQCTFNLKDSFKNIYTELQQNILGDELMIDIECQKQEINKFIKKKQEPINKYGVKRVRFSIDNSTLTDPVKTNFRVFLNKQKMCQFQILIQGQSLPQRRKNLQRELDKLNKGYSKGITVSRANFLQDLFKIAEKSLFTNFSVKFAGQMGIDAGGLKRQFYDMIGNEIKSDQNPFFKPTDSRKIFYFINPEILKNKKKQAYMELFGKYLANSILNGYLIGVNFSPVFVKLLYKDPVEFQDLLQVLPEDESRMYKYLISAPADDFDDLEIYFTVIVDKKKGLQVQLKEDGANIQVNHENVKEYLDFLTKVLIKNRYEQIMEAFRKGFESVISLNLLTKWIRPHELWCLTQGTKEINAQMVLNYVSFSGSTDQSIISWFRRYINESNRQVLEGFLKFASGSSSIDFDQTSKIMVTFENAGENTKKLPISHTCWKQIVVPKYKSYEIMHKLLNAAFIFCSEGFGFG